MNFTSAASKASPHLSVDATPVDAGGLEIKIGRSDLLAIGFLAGGVAASLAVAKILVPRIVDGVAEKTLAGNPAMGTGTAWLIADDYVLTNHHVINNRGPGVMASAAVSGASSICVTRRSPNGRLPTWS